MKTFKYAFFFLAFATSLTLSFNTQAAKNYNDCSIGICNFEEIQNRANIFNMKEADR